MKRYIDADAFRNKLKIRQVMHQDNMTERYECGCIIEMIDNTPTADVVEVVRCRDCKHSVRYECKNDACYKFTMCRRRDSYSEEVDVDDYCSYGERREE